MLIEAKNLSFAYGEKQVFSGLSLKVETGETVIISGPSGGGKSTLLKLFNRLHDPLSGAIIFNGRRLEEYKATELRRQVYYLQQAPVMTGGTVKDNLLLPFSFHSARHVSPPADDYLWELLDRFRLTDISLTGDAQKLSLGEKQRIVFIRAMLLKPHAMLLDEPISSLDPVSREIVEENIARMVSEKGMTAIIVMHFDLISANMKTARYRLAGGLLEEEN